MDSDSNSFSQMIQNIKVSVNLGRESLLELGRRRPYFTKLIPDSILNKIFLDDLRHEISKDGFRL